jgi:hypothetical protein
MQTRHSRLRLPSPALILACLALFAALGGGAYAASSIGTKGIHFTTVKLKSPWQAGSKTNHQDAPPGYAKDSLGVVHLRGDIFGSNDTTAFVLPKGARPSHLVYAPITTQSAAAGAVLIQPDGKVIPYGGNVNAFGSLDGVSFVAGE